MATNRKFADTHKTRALDVSDVNGSGTSNAVKSGDPGAVGSIPFVALTDEDSDGKATCQLDGTFRLSVRGHDGTSGSAGTIGEKVYWDNAAGEINVDTSGVPFGYLEEAVSAGATTTVAVMVQPGA